MASPIPSTEFVVSCNQARVGPLVPWAVCAFRGVGKVPTLPPWRKSRCISRSALRPSLATQDDCSDLTDVCYRLVRGMGTTASLGLFSVSAAILGGPESLMRDLYTNTNDSKWPTALQIHLEARQHSWPLVATNNPGHSASPT